jgi:hypothetical protein
MSVTDGTALENMNEAMPNGKIVRGDAVYLIGAMK